MRRYNFLKRKQMQRHWNRVESWKLKLKTNLAQKEETLLLLPLSFSSEVLNLRMMHNVGWLEMQL
jgi:hypothetical protein